MNTVDEITVFFRSISKAPALKKQRFLIDSSKTMYEIEKYLRRAIGGQKEVFLHINGFCPTPDQTLKELHDCFKTSSGELVISYGLQECWG